MSTPSSHPLLLWQSSRAQAARHAQARLLLVDIATERAQASAAQVAATDPRPSAERRAVLDEAARRWQVVAGGVALDEAACLIALARGLTQQLCQQRDDPALDPILSALALARLGGLRAERIVAAVESLLILPGLVRSRFSSRLRRGYAQAAMLDSYRSLRWCLSSHDPLDPQQAMATIIRAWASVEAEAIRRGLVPAGIDRAELSASVADLVAAQPGGATEDAVGNQPPVPEGNVGASEPGAENSLTLTPFPGFDLERINSSRSSIGQRYAVLAKRLSLTLVPSHEAASMALAGLRAEQPNFSEVIDHVSDELALIRRLGSQPALLLPPMVLVGPPGIGKTRFGRRLAECLGLAYGWLAMAGSTDNRELAGTSRGWSSAHPSWPVDQLAQLKRANPLLLIDEIDKAGGSSHNGHATSTLLTLLEPHSASAYHDECLGGPIDLSHIIWVLTANTADALPAPLLSRVNVLRVPPPSAVQVDMMIETMLADFAHQRGVSDPRLLPTLPPDTRERLREEYAASQDPRRLRAALVRSLAVAARLEEDAASRLAQLN